VPGTRLVAYTHGRSRGATNRRRAFPTPFDWVGPAGQPARKGGRADDAGAAHPAAPARARAGRLRHLRPGPLDRDPRLVVTCRRWAHADVPLRAGRRPRRARRGRPCPVVPSGPLARLRHGARRHRRRSPHRPLPRSLPGGADRPHRSGAGPRHHGHPLLPDRPGDGPNGNVEPPLRRAERARGGRSAGGTRHRRLPGSGCRDRRCVRRGARVGLGVGRPAPEGRAGGRGAAAGSAPVRRPLRHQQRPDDPGPPRRDRGRLPTCGIERPDGLRGPRRGRGAGRDLHRHTGLRGAPPVARRGHGRDHDRAWPRGVGPQAGRPVARGGGAAGGARRGRDRGARAPRRRRSLQGGRGGHRGSTRSAAVCAPQRRRGPGRGAPASRGGPCRDRGRRCRRIPSHRRLGDPPLPGRGRRRGAVGRNGGDRPYVPCGDSRRAQRPARDRRRAPGPCWPPAP
jgi:hypothetical protein